MIPGIDVSHWQGSIDWQRVKVAGIRFAYLKATQGATLGDPRLETNYEGAIQAGIPVGLYHVFIANAGNEQIDNWLKASKAFPCQLPAWLDIEPGAVTDDTVHQAIAFLGMCFQPSDCVYCSPSTAQVVLTDPVFQTYKLAIAHYTGAPSPNTVLWSDWLFWQHSAVGKVDGIETAVDLDWFHGSEEDFQSLILAKVT